VCLRSRLEDLWWAVGIASRMRGHSTWLLLDIAHVRLRSERRRRTRAMLNLVAKVTRDRHTIAHI
jgi:hypothetical protein